MKAHENSLNNFIEHLKRENRDYDQLIRIYAIQSIDFSECDNYIRNRVRGILSDFEIDGDSYRYPTLEDIVDKLVDKILALENSNCK